jgi:hypothetical protein
MQIGFSVVDKIGNEIQFWGDDAGLMPIQPNVIVLPNGDQVHCPSVGESYGDFRFVSRNIVFGTPHSIAFDGSSIVVTRETPPTPPPVTPEEISHRQFFHGLALQGVITKDEALAAVKTGTMPALIESFINAITDPNARFNAEILLSGATVFKRSHPLTAQFGAAQGWSSDQIDAFWRACAAL